MSRSRSRSNRHVAAAAAQEPDLSGSDDEEFVVEHQDVHVDIAGAPNPHPMVMNPLGGNIIPQNPVAAIPNPQPMENNP